MVDGIPLPASLPADLLLGITVLLLLTGRLIPRYIFREKSLEAQKWQEAYETEKEARATSDAQTRELLQVSQTNGKIISAMFESIKRLERSGGSNVAEGP